MSAKRRACLECRAKKVKCFPSAGRCTRCTDMRIEVCIYKQVKKRGTGTTLRTGEACEGCRAKKRKCDAKRPCTRCVREESVSECVYDDRVQLWSFSAVGPSSGTADPVQFLVLKLNNPLADGAFVDVPLPAEPDLPPPTSGATPMATYESATLQTFQAVQVPRRHSTGLGPFHRNSPERHLSSDTNPSISIIPSFLLPEIPPEPRISLSFLGEERLQVSGADTTDIDMRSRLWALLRLPKFGIHLKRERLDALMSGDQSGTVLDRFWVLSSHALGMPYSLRVDSTPGMVRLHARRSQIAWESLAELVKGNNHKLKVQAILVVASTFIYVNMMQSASLYIQKSCDYIKAGNLQFIPTYGRPPKFSEELHETLSALSQTIYWMNYSFLACGGPQPHATAKLEKEFRWELPQTYPFLFKTCPLTMRTQAILFVRDVILLLDAIPADGVGLGLWRRSCDHVSILLEDLSKNLFENTRTFREQGNEIGTDVICSSCITCLAHLAILYDVVCRTDPTAGPELYELCDSALQRLGMITTEHHFNEYTYHDLLLGESWKKSLDVFDARIASLPFKTSETLRYYRKVVKERHSDFQNRLPNSDAPEVMYLALSADGTTTDSKYPNLLLVEARSPYGI